MPMPPGRMTFALILSEDLFVYAKDLFIEAIFGERFERRVRQGRIVP